MRSSALVVVALLLAGCAAVTGPPAPTVAAGGPGAPPTSADDADAPAPTGAVTVAQPDPVVTWWQRDAEDLAAGDLAALWMLPLHRVDELGRHRPALATSARVDPDDPAGWAVELDLAPGTWSDGEPVDAGDVVATADALAAVRPAAWGAYVGAEAVDDDTVRLRFDRPYRSWPTLLSVAPGVLPEHVLSEDGLGAYALDVPVSGGWFRLGSWEPGVRASWVAHAGSPLGAPGLAELTTLVVPDHETALGLLDRGEVDVVLGHVVLDPAGRRAQVPGAVGAAVFGGTRFELVWEPDGGASPASRLLAAHRIDPDAFVDGLLRDVGRRPGGVWPAAAPLPSTPDGEGGQALVVQLPRTVEGLGLLARVVQSELSGAGLDVELLRVDPPEHVLRPVDSAGRLRAVRVPPQRSLAALLRAAGLDAAPGVAADAAGAAPADPAGRDLPVPASAGVDALVDGAWLVPLAEVAVAHVWVPDRVAGITPSGWPGLALWDVGAWSLPTP